MRIAHLADLHLSNAKDDSGETLDEQVHRLGWIAENAKLNDVELVVVAGDTFHARSNAAERNAAITVYRRLAEVATVVAVKGNNSHDGPGEVSFLEAIRSDFPIIMAERPRAIDVVTKSGAECLVFAMPFPEKAWLAAASDGSQPVTELAKAALRTLFADWSVRSEQRFGTPTILVGHLELGSATLDSGQPAVGRCFVELSEADLLQVGAGYYALGHIHKHQVCGHGRICYAGSPRQTTFGEDDEKGYCLVDIEAGEPPVIKHVRAPGPRLVTVEAELEDNLLLSKSTRIPLTDGTGIFSEEPSPVVRLVYDVPDSMRAACQSQAEAWREMFLGSGARSVRIDARVVPTTRTRSEAMRKAQTNEDRLRALWESKNSTPARAEAICEKLDDLEDEIANA